LLTGMAGNSLHMQWPLTSQLHGSVSQGEQLVFCYGKTKHPYPLCVQTYQNRKNIPNDIKLYQMSIYYSKWL
jgi:hypothetical protein